MTARVLDDETRRLIAQASRVDRSAEANADITEPEREYTTSVIEAVCTSCGIGTAHVVPRYLSAARCGTCIAEGRPPGGAPLAEDRPPTITRERLLATYEPPTREVPAPPAVPVVTTLDPPPEGYVPPSPVLKLQRAAETAGWTVRWHYSKRGTREYVSLRMSRGGWRAVAVYDGTSWGSMWGVGHMLPLLTVEELRGYLDLAGWPGIDEFVRDTRAAHGEAAAARAKRVKCRDIHPHAPHDWINANGVEKQCPGAPCDVLDKHEPHDVVIKIAGESVTRACIGRVRVGTAKKQADNGG